MKRVLLGCLLLIPFLLPAQNDSRYLAGAVPEEDGKVVFLKEVVIPGKSKEALFDIFMNWAKKNYNTTENRIAFFDQEKGDAALVGEEKLVFSSTALSLDKAIMYYRIIAECEDGSCMIRLSSIRYDYNVSYQQEPEKYTAETMISDKVALSKKNKLYRPNRKFRRATIDYVDKLFAGIDAAFGLQTAVNVAAPTVSQAAAVKKLTPEPAPREGYMSMSADKVPQALIQLLPQSRMQVTVGDAKTPVETKAEWKGISEMFGKTVASVSIAAESPVYKNISETYTLSFMRESETDPWMIIECRKQGETTEGGSKTLLGEITRVLVK